MNNVIRRTNKIVPLFNINDTSPITIKNKQKKEDLFNEISEEQFTDFTRKYRQIIQNEQAGSGQDLRNLNTQSTHNINNISYKNELNSRQSLDISEINEDNRSRHSLEPISPAKRTSKSLGILRLTSQPTPQTSTCISIQNSIVMQSPLQKSQRKFDLSPIQRINQRQLLAESSRNISDISPVPLIKMQDTFYQKYNKSQNQQFLDKCFGQSQLNNKESRLISPIRAQKFVPFNIASSSSLNEKKQDTFTNSKSIHGQELDILKQVNKESIKLHQNGQPNSSPERSSSLNQYLKPLKKQTYNITQNKRNTSVLSKRSEQLSQVLNQKLSEIQNKSCFLVHQEKDFTMNSSKNFGKHLSSLQDLSQSNRRGRKIRSLIDEMIKQTQEQEEEDSQSKTFKSLLNKQDYIITKNQKGDSVNGSRKSSAQESEQLHYFNQIRKESNIQQINENSNDNKQQSDAFNYSKFNKTKKDSPQNQEQIYIDKQFEENVKACKLLAQTAFEKLEKIKQMSMSQQSQIKILKDLLQGPSQILNIILDEDKEKFNQQLNIKMFENLILPKESIQTKEINVAIEKEFKLFIQKIQDFLFQTQIKKCETFKEEVLNECQSLQDISKKLEKEKKFNYSNQAKKTLDNLSFMGKSMLNKQHSLVDQLNKAQIKYGNLSLINAQNIQMNSQIENKIDKMVQQRQGQIKMKDIFQKTKQKQ